MPKTAGNHFIEQITTKKGGDNYRDYKLYLYHFSLIVKIYFLLIFLLGVYYLFNAFPHA